MSHGDGIHTTEMTDATASFSVPMERNERERLRAATEDYVLSSSLVPPLSMAELHEHTDAVCKTAGADPAHAGFITVLVANEVWKDTLASVPYERRVLLLPQCLRDKDECPATIDEFGLLCEECGRCPIGDIQKEAENLGYVVLVAEGTTVVTKLLEGGKIDAVIGVSCLSALERSFPHMASHAIPGFAVPLVTNGCVNTTMDTDWVREAMRLRLPGPWHGRQDLDSLREEVECWFALDKLKEILGTDDTTTENISVSWLAKAGKRWRPFLSACVYKSLKGFDCKLPEDFSKLAVAVECFHKASLIHDDIEDNDSVRYGEQTLHEEYGIPVALNAGDLLIGDGYRLISETAAEPVQIVDMLRVASQGHRMLCLGQGEELSCISSPIPLPPTDILEIFRRKTAPAFEVALQLGAIYAGGDATVRKVLAQFSESLGIAYQIRDDIRDLQQDHEESLTRVMGPSLLLSLAYWEADEKDRSIVTGLQSAVPGSQVTAGIRDLLGSPQITERANQLLEHHKNHAIRSLAELQNAHLKGLLRRLITRILDGD